MRNRARVQPMPVTTGEPFSRLIAQKIDVVGQDRRRQLIKFRESTAG